MDHSDTCDDDGKLEASVGDLADGLHWVPCDVVIADGGSGSNVTVVSSGLIEVSDSDVGFGSPFVDGVSLYSTLSGSDAVKVGGSESSFDGAVVAPFGRVEVSGSNNTFNCGVLADTVKLSGSDLTVSGCELTTSDFDVTTTSRTYAPDGLLSRVDIVSPGGSVDVYELLWDRTLPVSQVVTMSVNGDTTSFTYGVRRAQAIDSGGAGTSFGYSVLGDVTAGPMAMADGFDPYGIPDTATVAVGFGYRGELHVGDQVYLRFRDHVPALGRFLTSDPLPGVAGTPTVVNGYAYAANDPIQLTDPLGLRPSDRDLAPDSPSIAPDIVALHQMSSPADGILSAMKVDINSQEARRIRAINSADNPGVTCHFFCNLFLVGAGSLWVKQVHAGGPWDYKPQIRQVQQGFDYWPLDASGDVDVFFDVWSNVHYGYVGGSVGFSLATLQFGADLGRRFPALERIAGENDRSDVVSVEIGFRLWERHGAGLTYQQLVDAVRAAQSDYEAAALADFDRNVRVRDR